jgi:hypothetical protein
MKKKSPSFYAQLFLTVLVCSFPIVPAVQSVIAGLTENFLVGIRGSIPAAYAMVKGQNRWTPLSEELLVTPLAIPGLAIALLIHLAIVEENPGQYGGPHSFFGMVSPGTYVLALGRSEHLGALFVVRCRSDRLGAQRQHEIDLFTCKCPPRALRRTFSSRKIIPSLTSR